MRVLELPSQVRRELRPVEVLVQLFDTWTDYHSEAELLLEQFAADFWQGFLKKAGGTQNENRMYNAREELLEI